MKRITPTKASANATAPATDKATPEENITTPDPKDDAQGDINVVRDNAERRKSLAAKLAGVDEQPPMDPRFKRIIPLLLSEGELLDEIVKLPGFPTRSQIYAAEEADPLFAAAMVQATDNCARTLLSESQALAREAAAQNDKDKAVIAEKLAKATIGFAEKSSPKKFGNLVKLADKDGEALQVHVINFGALPNGGALKPVIDGVATEVIGVEEQQRRRQRMMVEDAEYEEDGSE